MGIKFLASNTPGVKPTVVQLAEREAAFNIPDKKIFFSDGAAIHEYNFKEIAGRKYIDTEVYSEGDLVTYNDVLYISLSDNNSGNPPGASSSYWEDTRVKFRYIGSFMPNGGNEYPDTSGRFAGSYWRIGGLDTPYTYTTGDLAGITVENNDEIFWYGEVWEYRPHIELEPEVGGKMWIDTYRYSAGDVVSHKDKLYISITTSENMAPDLNSDKWLNMDELAGAKYDPDRLEHYRIGDIVTKEVTGGFTLFVCAVDAPTIEPDENTKSSEWTRFGDLVIELLNGYYIFNPYNIYGYPDGTVVSYAHKIFAANGDIEGFVPGSSNPIPAPGTPEGASIWIDMIDEASSSLYEVAGRGWKQLTEYINGDVVTYNGILYMAIADHTSGTSWEPANWTTDFVAETLDPGLY